MRELLEVGDLGERYHLPTMKERVIKQLPLCHIKRDADDIIDAAMLANEFNHHTEMSEALLDTCADHMRLYLDTPATMTSFMQ